MKTPAFWGRCEPDWRSHLLTPLSWAWQAGAAIRGRRTLSYCPSIPVLCVGNAVMGGAGKTPVAADLARELVAAGHEPHFLSRGYGGSVDGPHRVDPMRDTAKTVGDEPLLLARTAPVWVAANRAAGARAAEQAGATHIVMDDGFQNASVAKTVSILVVDALYGFGNGRICPAGPLREPARDAVSRADMIVFIGPHDTALPIIPAVSGKPVLRAEIVASSDTLHAGAPCFAFAGIGRPEKFFATAQEMGLKLRGVRSFPDHHAFSEAEMRTLVRDADAVGAQLITTEKDAVRVPPQFIPEIAVIPIELKWSDERTPLTVLTTDRAHVV